MGAHRGDQFVLTISNRRTVTVERTLKGGGELAEAQGEITVPYEAGSTCEDLSVKDLLTADQWARRVDSITIQNETNFRGINTTDYDTDSDAVGYCLDYVITAPGRQLRHLGFLGTTARSISPAHQLSQGGLSRRLPDANRMPSRAESRNNRRDAQTRRWRTPNAVLSVRPLFNQVVGLSR
jgi:hypothetical protein